MIHIIEYNIIEYNTHIIEYNIGIHDPTVSGQVVPDASKVSSECDGAWLQQLLQQCRAALKLPLRPVDSSALLNYIRERWLVLDFFLDHKKLKTQSLI